MIRDYTLRLKGVRFRATIGASAAERTIPQDLVVDVDLELPVSALPKRDTKREVLDYDRAVRLVVEVGLAEPEHDSCHGQRRDGQHEGAPELLKWGEVEPCGGAGAGTGGGVRSGHGVPSIDVSSDMCSS